MFHSIRNRFQNFQTNLSTTLRSLSVNDPLTKKPYSKESIPININAGAEVIEKFQTYWFELHDASQANASKAQKVDEKVTTLHKTTEKQWKDIAHIIGLLNTLPDIINSVNELCNKTVSMKELFDNVEKGLMQLYDLVDMRELQNRQLEQKFQLALYREKRLKLLEDLKISLDETYQEKVKLCEAKEAIGQQENLSLETNALEATDINIPLDINLDKQKIEENNSEINMENTNEKRICQ